MALISTRSALESSVTPNRSNPNCTISERHVEQATGSEVRAVTIAVTADQLGHNRVTLRCDNEPAIEALAGEVPQARQEGSQTVPERPPVAESQSNLDHRTCSGTRGRPGQNTEGCVGASYWDQSPQRKDTNLAGGICCVPGESAGTERHLYTGCMGERTTHRSWNLERRSCMCRPSQQEEESGNRDSIQECLSAC